MGAGQLLTLTQISAGKFLLIRREPGATQSLFASYCIQQATRQEGVCLSVSEGKDTVGKLDCQKRRNSFGALI